MAQSHRISTKTVWAILGNNCLAGHSLGIRARSGAPEWSHRYESWSSLGQLVDLTWWTRSRDQRMPQRGEMRTRVHRDVVLRPCPDKTATPVVPRYLKGNWKCWGSYSKMWETWEYRTWDRQAGVQGLYWCSGWLATSVNSWMSCRETWDIGH